MSQKPPLIFQHDSKDCGPSCLQMVHQFHGGRIAMTRMRDLCDLSLDGVSMHGLARAAEALHMDALATQAAPEALHNLPLPFIAHWLQDHFVVVYKMTAQKVFVADPEQGYVAYSHEDFLDRWLGQKIYGVVQTGKAQRADSGAVLVLSPDEGFADQPAEDPPKKPLIAWSDLRGKLGKDGLMVALAFPLTMAVTIALPLIMQRVIDQGILAENLNAVMLFLLGYLVLSLSHNVIGAVRDLLLLRIGANISIEIVHRFMQRLLSLHISFFERRSLGDLVQRQNDHRRIEQFLTTQSLPTFFAILTFIVFAIMLGVYDLGILALFSGFAALSVLWVEHFRKRRRSFDMQQFELEGIVQENTIEIMSAVVDLKSFGMTAQKGRFYRSLLRRRYDTTLRALRLDEMQNIGAVLLMDIGEIAALYLAGRAVIVSGGTLGEFVAVMYILGQMRGPLARMVPFFQSAQDAWLSLQRLQSLQQEPDEPTSLSGDTAFSAMPAQDLIFDNVSFRYNEMHEGFILKDLSFTVPHGQKTAIVGASGSGKTTLLKLISKFHPPTTGNITYGGLDLAKVSADLWRRRIGPVLQEGTIFNNTLAYNITLSHDAPNAANLDRVMKIANVAEFLELLPYKLLTTIGRSGWQLSSGQKQRVLIARALYRNPEILIFDEATSALDSNNEAEITENLADMVSNRTSIVISHRLSTINDADQVLVLKNGRIVEQGTHNALVQQRGQYFDLFYHQINSNYSS